MAKEYTLSICGVSKEYAQSVKVAYATSGVTKDYTWSSSGVSREDTCSV